MKILRECLLLCTLITLLGRDVAAKFPVYNGNSTYILYLLHMFFNDNLAKKFL